MDPTSFPGALLATAAALLLWAAASGGLLVGGVELLRRAGARRAGRRAAEAAEREERLAADALLTHLRLVAAGLTDPGAPVPGARTHLDPRLGARSGRAA
ncbi:hypothetical protein [Vallicoccus soli]|uniref:Histidine kinase n=1 Tax=Vallicoccus soli TaxID=2339232 RepID=A0A3A3Z464_9ACTN|nr:hypothetical protein [Vallicoccus soli]RJK97753.1 hypothetical protein D5H78_01785 [Vallicoccus soli]